MCAHVMIRILLAFEVSWGLRMCLCDGSGGGGGGDISISRFVYVKQGGSSRLLPLSAVSFVEIPPSGLR